MELEFIISRSTDIIAVIKLMIYGNDSYSIITKIIVFIALSILQLYVTNKYKYTR